VSKDKVISPPSLLSPPAILFHRTTLISALTLDAFYGTPTGVVTLNGAPMTDNVFKKHCFVVKQQDKHWPYLSTRETLTYAAELYAVASKGDIAEIVSEMISKMGLDSCADTRCARLSGGQRRRLSIAVALLKQPTLLFLDEYVSCICRQMSYYSCFFLLRLFHPFPTFCFPLYYFLYLDQQVD
jgi:ABC-type nitrate/sulfonate/bicarbonate transport system ATPase subunit